MLIFFVGVYTKNLVILRTFCLDGVQIKTFTKRINSRVIQTLFTCSETSFNAIYEVRLKFEGFELIRTIGLK